MLDKTSWTRALIFVNLIALGGAWCFATTPQGDPGVVRFYFRQGPDFDSYTNNATPSQQQAMAAKFWRAEEFHPYFDDKLSWYPHAMTYMDSQAIYVNAQANMSWVLRDANGQPLYLNWGCGGGTCPQYAANFADASSGGYRAWWISQAQQIMALGYDGIWVDDVNLYATSNPINVVHADGSTGVPIDTNTGQPMTQTAWNQYMVNFMNLLRSSIPANKELLHNDKWFAGNGTQGTDPLVQQEIGSSDFINIEGGICDAGIVGGTSYWSLTQWFNFIDRVHALGKGVVLDNFCATAQNEYALAGYFMISNGTDSMGEPSVNPQTNWWAGYDVSLGAPKGARYQPSGHTGLWERDYANGIVLLVEPSAPTTTVTLPQSYKRIDGSQVTSVQLSALQGTVLIGGGVTTGPITVNQASPSSLLGQPGQAVSFTTKWAGGPTAVSQEIFLHVVDASGNKVFQDTDHYPSVLTTQWSTTFSDARILTLPSTLAAGTYKLMVGFYDPNTTNRLALTDGTGVTDDGTFRYQVATLTVGTPAVTLTKSASVSNAKSGDTVTYTIQYQNTGGATASSVVITDALPVGTTLVPGSITAGGALSSGIIQWTIGSIAGNSAAQQVSFQVKVN